MEACPIKDISTETIVQALFKTIISRHGCPHAVLTNQGTQFTSELFTKVLNLYGITKLEATAAHQQTNGKVQPIFVHWAEPGL